MNCLNSILLEGDCASEPGIVVTQKGDKCEFKVRSQRQDPEGQNEESTFGVEAYGRLAQTIAVTMKMGRGVRIVGRIKEDVTCDDKGLIQSCTKIIAEHVEFKPGRCTL
jgi:single-strand DNA-binding protein